MIDGINCRVYGDSLQNILDSDKLQFKDYPNRREAKYKGLIISIYPEPLQCCLRGSIHKFKNEGLHNADLFTYHDFCNSLIKLEQELGIFSSDLQIIRFEIGINILLIHSPSQYINIISEIQNIMPTKKIHSLSVEYSQYIIKVYSKSKQFKEFRDKNILRIEIAYLKKQKLTQDLCRLSTLDELLNYSIWEKIVKVLKELMSKFTFFDYSEIKRKNLTNYEIIIFYEWSNAVRISQEINRSRVSRMRKKVNEIYQKYSENKKANELLNMIDERLAESINLETNNATVLPII